MGRSCRRSFSITWVDRSQKSEEHARAGPLPAYRRILHLCRKSMILKLKNSADDQLADDPAGDTPRPSHPARQRLQTSAEAAQPPEAPLDRRTQRIYFPSESAWPFEQLNAAQACRGMLRVSQTGSRLLAWGEQLETVVGRVLMRRIGVVSGICQQIAGGVLLGQMINQLDGALLVRDVQRSHDQRVGHHPVSPSHA